MIRIAFVGSRYGEQVKENPAALAGVSVAHCRALGELEARARDLSPTVVVVGLEELGEPPLERIHQLVARSGAKLVVVVYAWARRDLVIALSAHPRVRLVQGPLSLGNLRCQMLHLIVGDILEDEAAAGSTEPPATCPTCGGTTRRAAAVVR